MRGTHGDVATAVATFDRAAVMEPSSARIKQKRGACKDCPFVDDAGAISNLVTAVVLGLDNWLIYRYRGWCQGIGEANSKQLLTTLIKLPQSRQTLSTMSWHW